MGSQLAHSMRVVNHRLTSSTKGENEDETNLDEEINLLILAATTLVEKHNKSIEESEIIVASDSRNKNFQRETCRQF